MPLLKECCACISLKTATIIIGALDIVGIVAMAVFIIIVNALNVEKAPINSYSTAGKVAIYFILALALLASILLIVGAVKANRWLLFPWLIVTVLTLIISLITTIYDGVKLFQDDYILDGITTLVTGPVGTAIHFYLWLVVFSYHTFLREEKNLELY